MTQRKPRRSDRRVLELMAKGATGKVVTTKSLRTGKRIPALVIDIAELYRSVGRKPPGPELKH